MAATRSSYRTRSNLQAQGVDKIIPSTDMPSNKTVESECIESEALNGSPAPSFTPLPNWLAGQATYLEISVLWVLQKHYPNIRPSTQRIGDLIGMHRSTVIKVLNDMERKGWVARVRRFSSDGRSLPNDYELRIWPSDAQVAGAIGATPIRVPGSRGGVAQDDTGVAQDDTRKHSGFSGNPLKLGVAQNDREGRSERQGGSSKTTQSKSITRRSREEELSDYSSTYIHQREAKIDATAPTVTTAEPVATAVEIVIASAHNDAPQRHAQSATQVPATASALPDCARPYRQLLREWWHRRRSKHPAAAKQLSAGDIQAILHADALGVLQPFLELAAASGCKTLATGYRGRCAQLRAGPAAAEAFDTLRSAYLAAPRRVPCQSLPAAQREFSAVLAEGHTAEQLVAALAAEIRAQDQQHASTGFAPSLPDIARWLKERRFAAYLQQNQPVAPAAFEAPIDPETGAPDPFAYHRHVTGQ
jgi:hypothetical protein